MHKHILVTGLMGSGKSVLLLEYMLNFKTLEFTKPPVEAKFQGQDFEFLDNVFAIRNKVDDNIYNFYELDAPTIKRWTQFIEAAQGIILVVNDNPFNEYSTPESLLNALVTHGPQTPILFVSTNYDDFNSAKNRLEDKYNIKKLTNPYEIIGVGKGEELFDEIYGKRYKLEPDKLKLIFDWHLQRIKE